MKKFLITPVWLLCLVCLFMMTACGEDNTPPTSSPEEHIPENGIVFVDENTVVFTATSDVMPIGEKTMLIDYLGGLQEKALLTYDGYTGDYGYYVTAVNGKAEAYGDTSMQYWAFYTNLYSYNGVDYALADYGTYEYGGVTYCACGYGVSAMPVVQGYTYVIAYTTYSYA